jgi:hypothetical protein
MAAVLATPPGSGGSPTGAVLSGIDQTPVEIGTPASGTTDDDDLSETATSYDGFFALIGQSDTWPA